MNNNDSYINTLQECSQLAHEENNLANDKLKQLKEDLMSSQKVLVKGISDFDKSYVKEKTVTDTLNIVNNKTTELLRTEFEKFENSFVRKSNNLKDFTVTLFGRTKAGKSTIRESLTNGDGSTIGTGAQRTTRDFKIYSWNHLRILDTPGFDAYNGEEDEKIAFSQVDETDLILFLLTGDSIEESEFDKLASLRRENKPVIILLNVLYNLNHPTKRKLFLNNPQKFVSQDAIKGHKDRLEFLSKKYFDIHDISVIPIHALSAFESTKSSGIESKQLYDASNFKYFSDYIINEIKTSGKQKRVQSFRDSYIFHLENSIKPVYIDSYENLKPVASFLQNKQKELKNWFFKFISDKNDEIERKSIKMFSPLFTQLDSFVDQNIEYEDFENRWNSFVRKSVNEEKVKRIQETIISEMNKSLNEFFKEFELDLLTNISGIKSKDIEYVKKGYTGTVSRWTGTALGTASSLILSTAVANSWNPIGWAMAVGGIGLSLFFGGDDTKRFNKKKSEMKNRLNNSLQEMQRENISELREWLNQSINHDLKKKINEDLDQQVKLFRKLINEYSQKVEKIDSVIYKENADLLKYLLNLNSSSLIDGNILKNVVRCQGLYTKVLLEKHLFNGVQEREFFEKIYGEEIIEINANNDTVQLLLDALNSNTSEIDHVHFNDNENEFIIRVNENLSDKIYGVSKSNVKTAEKIMNKKIKIELI